MDATYLLTWLINQSCQPDFFKIWGVQIFLLKKPVDFTLGFTLNKNILKSQKIGLQAISLLFESVFLSIEMFLGASDLFDA